MNILQRPLIFSFICLSVLILRPAVAYSPDSVTDPTGDSAIVRPTDTPLLANHTDITSAWLRPAYNYPAIELGVSISSPIPSGTPYDFNFFFFFDLDGNVTNNDQAGTRAGADSAYSLMYAAAVNSWRTITWTYDAEAGEWSWEEDPRVLFGIYPERIILHVPPEYFPEDGCPFWRASVAASDGEGGTNGDSVPNGEGQLINNCDPENEPTVVSGLIEAPPAPTPTLEPNVPTADYDWLKLLAAAMFLGGGIVLAGSAAKGRKKPAPKETPTTEKKDDEEKRCCRTCSMFVSVGNQDDVPIRSAANLGRGIRRDTEKSTTIPADDKCLKVAHFHFDTFEKGRRLTSDGQGDELKIEDFNTLDQYFEVENHDEIDLWKEVMIVNHGDQALRVKNVIRNFTRLIPEKPVLKVVLYYCGGGRTLPEAEFKKLAQNLGRRLKDIPEECRRKFDINEVKIYIAPIVGFCPKRKKKLYTRLAIEQQGLVSFEGKMTLYTADENGRVTLHGNVDMLEKQLFGNTPLGVLHRSEVADANVYYEFWREVCCLPYSEIQRRRALVETHKTKIPTYTKPAFTCPVEEKANIIQAKISQAHLKKLSDAEMDRALDCDDEEEFKKYLLNIR